MITLTIISVLKRIIQGEAKLPNPWVRLLFMALPIPGRAQAIFSVLCNSSSALRRPVWWSGPSAPLPLGRRRWPVSGMRQVLRARQHWSLSLAHLFSTCDVSRAHILILVLQMGNLGLRGFYFPYSLTPSCETEATANFCSPWSSFILRVWNNTKSSNGPLRSLAPPSSLLPFSMTLLNKKVKFFNEPH